MRFALATLVLALAVSGCASVSKQPISAQDRTSIQGKSLAVTARAKPDFAAMTAGKATFALIGAIAAISEGNSLVASNNVADPANVIASSLAKSLEAAHAVRTASAAITVTADDAAQIASSLRSTADYALDVQTLNWSINYFPTDWTHYRVFYTAKARLINTQTGAVVASGFCKRIPDTNVGAPTWDELMANQAARLKSELDIAAKECIDTLKTEMLAA